MMDATGFLDYLWPPFGYVEMRLIRPGEVLQDFYRDRGNDVSLVAHGAPMVEIAPLYDENGWDVYIGVLPRCRPRGTEKDVFPFTDILWADLDAKDGRTKDDIFRSVAEYPWPPTSVVDSGHGYHCTWKLSESYPFTDAQRVMKDIARRLHGDAVYDAPRILRLPGTHNHKTEPPVPVRLLALDLIHRYRLSDFDVRSEVFPKTVLYRIGDGAVNAALPMWLITAMTSPYPRGARSEAIYKVCRELIERGWGDQEIISIIISEPKGIGEKAWEQKDPEAYLRRTLRKARG